MDITFLGTGAAWGLPQLNCGCLICREMRRASEKRQRTSLLLSNTYRLLIDCGPDISSQLFRNRVKSLDAVFITHEHADHYLGLDELYTFKLTALKGTFFPIPVYLTETAWEVISRTFGYLKETGVIDPRIIEPKKWFRVREFDAFAFPTDHGPSAKGSVGFAIRCKGLAGKDILLVYTSDFMVLPDIAEELLYPDYLVLESFWLNEPVENRPCHMSFQKAIHFIEHLRPKMETFLVHMGDNDMVPGDPANGMTKKVPPKDPLSPALGREPYPIPLNQQQWQETVNMVMSDRGLPYKVTVACDDLKVRV